MDLVLTALSYAVAEFEKLTTIEKLAFGFSVVSYVPYLYSTLMSDGRPTISTWLSWWIMDIAIIIAMFAEHAVAIQMVAYVAGCAFVLLACFYRKGDLGWRRIDTVCVGLVALAMAVWALSGNPNIAIVMSLIAVVISCVPMVINLIKDPTREPLLPWVLLTIGGLCGVLAINHVTVAEAATPVVFFIAQVLFLVLTFRKFKEIGPNIPLGKLLDQLRD